MRISLIGPAWPYRGGISHYNTCLAAQLAGQHEVEVVNFSRLYPEFLFPGKTQFDESDDAHKVDSLRLIDSMNPFTWIRAGSHIARQKPDAVIVQWWHPYFAPALFKICSIIRMFSKARVIFLCHNVIPHERSWVDNLLTKMAFSLSNGFVVHSQEDLDNLLTIREDTKALLSPLPIFDFFRSTGISREEARNAIEEGPGPLLLFFGFIRPYKGLKHLIEAMKQLRAGIEARLLVVGEFYEEKQPYIDLVEENGLAGSIRFVDRYVSNEEVENYFIASDLVVLPYTSATQSAIAQIAIAFERPMIVTRTGGLPEAVIEGRTGFVVDAGDPEAIAATAGVFFREGLAGDMAPFFEDEKKRFSWETMADRLVGLIEELSGVRYA